MMTGVTLVIHRGSRQEGKHQDNWYREDKLIKKGIDGMDAFSEVFLYVHRRCPPENRPADGERVPDQHRRGPCFRLPLQDQVGAQKGEDKPDNLHDPQPFFHDHVGPEHDNKGGQVYEYHAACGIRIPEAGVDAYEFQAEKQADYEAVKEAPIPVEEGLPYREAIDHPKEGSDDGSKE